MIKHTPVLPLAFALWTAIGITFLAACTQDKEAIVQAKVAERVSYFKSQKSAECRERLLATAEKTVDSILLAEAQQSLLDSLARLRPNRPFQPPKVNPIDSLTVKPIFNDSSQDNEDKR